MSDGRSYGSGTYNGDPSRSYTDNLRIHEGQESSRRMQEESQRRSNQYYQDQQQRQQQSQSYNPPYHYGSNGSYNSYSSYGGNSNSSTSSISSEDLAKLLKTLWKGIAAIANAIIFAASLILMGLALCLWFYAFVLVKLSKEAVKRREQGEHFKEIFFDLVKRFSDRVYDLSKKTDSNTDSTEVIAPVDQSLVNSPESA